MTRSTTTAVKEPTMHPASPARFEELLAIARTRSLSSAEKAELSGAQQERVGLAVARYHEDVVRAAQQASPVWRHAHRTPKDEAAIAAAWAETGPSDAALHEALIAAEAAGLNLDRVRQGIDRPYESMTAADRRVVSDAEALHVRAQRDLAEATEARDRAHARAVETEHAIDRAVAARFRAAVTASNEAEHARWLAERDAERQRPDPRPARLAAALDRLRVAVGQKAAS